VTAIDPFIDASSNTFTVIAEVENPGLALPAGTSCAVRGKLWTCRGLVPLL